MTEEEIEFYNEEINLIRNEITMGSISYYKLLLLSKKTLLIGQKLRNYNMDIKKNMLKKSNKNFYKSIHVFILLLPLIAALLGYIFQNFLIVIVIGLLNAKITFNIIKERNVKQKENMHKVLRFNEIMNKFENTSNILTIKLNKKSSKEAIKENLSEGYIGYLVITEDDNVMNEIPNNTKKEIIKILQQDLGVGINDFDELIKLAQEKISDDTLKRELKIKN